MEQAKLPDSVLKVQHFFRTIAYNIGGYTFTPDDIEHGILRGRCPELLKDDDVIDSGNVKAGLIWEFHKGCL